jgi:hypothetical protein
MSDAENGKRQFRVLRRQFLFRVVELEILSSSALGDSTRLLGRFAALLVFLSLAFSLGLLGLDISHMAPGARLALTLYMEHFLVATTMLMVGLFAVLIWDSIFPDRRDVLVLGPLPVRARTVFLAKLAAVGAALTLVVVLLNCATGLGWPIAFALLTPASDIPVLGAVRRFAAYWFTMFAAATFICSCVLAVQGVAAQLLPRRLFLRVSGMLQIAAFCLFICAYFLEPAVDGLQTFVAPENHRFLLCVPTYWFLGLLDELNGPAHSVFTPLARRAWIGLALAVLAAAAAYALSYRRTMRQIVEEPDIRAGPRGLRWLPRFGSQVQTAIGQFTVRSVARSRQHRLIWAFYLGTGLGCTIFLFRIWEAGRHVPGAATSNIWQEANAPLLVASILMTVFAAVGLRVVFAFPLEPRANWIFQVAGIGGGLPIASARRRALLLLAVTPVWAVFAVACLRLWPWRQAAVHLIVLALLGTILADVALYGFRKIPFTCSYLPGKTPVHLIFLATVGLVWLAADSVLLEQQALREPRNTVAMLMLLGVVAAGMRWRVRVLARSDERGLQFEEEAAPAILELGLFCDGAVIGSPDDPARQ